MPPPFDLIRALIPWIIVALALAAGLVGAYGRERHEGRYPNASWWLIRLCIMPFLAIVVAAAIDQFALTRQQYALLASLLSLMGYESVRIILERAARRGQAVLDAMDVRATPKPYASLIERDNAGHAVARVAIYDQDRPVQAGVGDGLRTVYSGAVAAPPSSELDDLLGEIDRRTDNADRDASQDPPLRSPD